MFTTLRYYLETHINYKTFPLDLIIAELQKLMNVSDLSNKKELIQEFISNHENVVIFIISYIYFLDANLFFSSNQIESDIGTAANTTATKPTNSNTATTINTTNITLTTKSPVNPATNTINATNSTSPTTNITTATTTSTSSTPISNNITSPGPSSAACTVFTDSLAFVDSPALRNSKGKQKLNRLSRKKVLSVLFLLQH